MTEEESQQLQLLSKPELEKLIYSYLNPTKNHKSVKINKWFLIKIITAILGYSVGIPYMNSARAFAGDNDIFAEILSITELNAIGVITAWLFVDIIRDLERIDKKSMLCNPKALATLISSSILGLITALPATIISLTYNNGNLLMAVLAFMGDFIANTFALNKLFDSSYKRNQYLRNNNFKLYLLKASFLHRISTASTNIINSNDPLNNPISSYIHNKNLLDISSLNYLKAIEDLIIEGSNIEIERSTSKVYLDEKQLMFPTYTTGIISPIAWYIVDFTLVQRSVLAQTKSHPYSYLTSLLATTPIYILEALFAKRIFYSAYHACLNKIKQIPNKSFAHMYYPKTYYTLLAIGLFSAVLAFASRAQIVDDNIDSFAKFFLVPWTIISNVSMKSYAMILSIPAIIKTISLSIKNKHQNIAELNDEYETLCTFIQEMDPNEFLSLLTHLNLENITNATTKDKILHKRITKTQLENTNSLCWKFWPTNKKQKNIYDVEKFSTNERKIETDQLLIKEDFKPSKKWFCAII